MLNDFVSVRVAVSQVYNGTYNGNIQKRWCRYYIDAAVQNGREFAISDIRAGTVCEPYCCHFIVFL